jgi:quercetin 2,3-dioxygenase
MSAVLSVRRLGFVWDTLDPFLFCVHHDDAYPAGNERLGPAASLDGRNLGQDFEPRDGWRMYHGEEVPGFPHHPHRGFETVTLVRRGLVDHSDSLGAAARFGGGDVQWLTAGRGIVHSEMFPLLERQAGNPLELFQIWLNLPRADKFAAPHFAMFWAPAIPTVTTVDAAGRPTTVVMIAGASEGQVAPRPPPDSWASKADSDLAIWTIRLAPGARYTLPPARPGTNRMLYLFAGAGARIDGHNFTPSVGIHLRPDAPVAIEGGPVETELLLLQGRPIGEPVVQHGPFVMTTQAEIAQAFADYRRDRFGGWPWPGSGPVHPREEGRFARHADGRVEKAPA